MNESSRSPSDPRRETPEPRPRPARNRRLVLVSVIACSMCLVMLGVLIATRARAGAAIYTDGAAIRVLSAAAPLRTVLWEPAQRIPGDSPANGDEYEPRVSADGTTMIFVRGKPGAEQQNADLFSSRLTPSGWSTPSPIDVINSPADELGPELSRDGQRLYFYSDRDGGLGGYDLWSSRRDGDAWLPPVNLGAAVNTAFNEYGPALTPDGSRLFFASNRPRAGEPVPVRDAWNATLRENRSRHDYDLFESRIDIANGIEPAQSHPIAPLNTLADEGAPAISPAGDFLYFSSDRDGGLGGFDVYRVRLVQSGFGAIENIGAAINSAADDMDPALSADGFRLFFSSNRSGPTAAPATPVHPALPATQAGSTPSPNVNPGATPASTETASADSNSPSISPANAPSAPAVAANASPASSTSEPLPFRLWGSVSREVYLDREAPTGPSLSELLGSTWPWLLLLLLLAALAYFLSRLLRSATWRRRFGRLSLLAQCLLVSLGLHMLIAGLMALWRVGTQVGEFLQDHGGGGGTRVVLASIGPAGDAASQIRGAFLTSDSLSTPISFDMPLERPASPSRDAAIEPMVTTAADPVANLETKAMDLARETTRPAPDAPAELSALTTPAVSTSTIAAAAPTATAPDAARAEPVAPRAAIAPSTLEAPPLTVSSAVPSLTNVSSSPPATASIVTRESAANVANPVAERSSGPSTELGTPSLGAVAPATPNAAAAPSIPASIAAGDNPATEPSVESRTGSAIREAALSAGDQRPRLAIAGTTDGAVTPRINTNAPASNSVIDDSSSSLAIPTSAPSRSGGDIASSTQMPLAAPGSIVPAASASPGRIAAALPASAPAADAGATEGAKPPGPRTPAVALGDSLRAGVSTGPRATDMSPVAPGGPDSLKSLSSINPAPSPGTSPGSSPAAIAPGRSEAPPGATDAPGSAPFALRAPAPLGGPAGSPLGDARLPAEEAPVQPKETFAQRKPEVRTEVLEQMGGSKETEKAVALALDWFIAHQESDGRWSGRHFDDKCGKCGDPSEFESDGAMTGIVLLCFLGAGHTHVADGPYKDHVARAMSWLLARQEPTGDLRRGETMYSQTVLTVALCEAIAMTRDPKLTVPTRRAVAFLEANWQAKASRRGEESEKSRNDNTSVLGWQVMAIESARRAGITISNATFDAAGKWLDYVADSRQPGRYSYRPGEAPSAAMTAEAMFVRQLLGSSRDGASMKQSAEFILQSMPRWNGASARTGQPNRGVTRPHSPPANSPSNEAQTYYWYYATLALFQHQGDAWKQWNEALAPALLSNQHQSGPSMGSWDPQDQWSRLGGRLYQTAICTLSLEVYYRYKPNAGAPAADVPSPVPQGP